MEEGHRSENDGVGAMQLEEYFEFETLDTKFGPVECIRIKGHRIEIEHVIEFLNKGMSPEEVVVKCYPSLTLDQVRATQDFYAQNRARVEEYLRHGEEICDMYYQEWLKEEAPTVMKKFIEAKRRRDLCNGASQVHSVSGGAK